MADFSDSVHIAAPADTVYAMVSDLTRMGEWSPENIGARWLNPRRPAEGSGPRVGARFIGHNKAGVLRWSTFGLVTVADPGREFAFEVAFGPMPVAYWQYLISGADKHSCTVTEAWTDRRPGPLRPVLDAVFRANRLQLNTRGIHKTLANLKRAAESG
ncbi:MAG: SRPBCC family protein [Actinomycetota bacterium]|nr:SRPBCC family protein [Actinomycetota bacterium]MDQ2957582.1 SRPBCC family protein [Actinomycetota bacterium]